jgi:DNA-binding NarL/FixJ family response regulator
MNPINVALFDDNDSLRDSICLLLEDTTDMHLVGSFAHCNDVLTDIGNALPDVVIMDIDMPGVNGIEGVKKIRTRFPSVQVLMQTVFDDDEKVFAAIKAGAGGYILKNAKSQNILQAVREVYLGGAPMTPSIARRVLLQFQSPQKPVEEFNLSPREKEVLELLVKGLSYKMIADKLFITYATVRAHMTKIYEKLHVSSMTEAVAKAINSGLFNS